MEQLQKRTVELAITGLQAREEGEEKKRIIEGYALKYNTRSVDLMPWSRQYAMFEVLKPGCISREMLREQDFKFTCFHNREKIIGRWNRGEGTLKIALDDVGMKVACEVPDTELGKEMYELVSRGDLSGMSFVYSTDENDSVNCVSMERMEGERYNDKDVYVRNVKCIKRMYDVTIAADPAYKDTEVSAKEREALEAAIGRPAAEPQGTVAGEPSGKAGGTVAAETPGKAGGTVAETPGEAGGTVDEGTPSATDEDNKREVEERLRKQKLANEVDAMKREAHKCARRLRRSY